MGPPHALHGKGQRGLYGSHIGELDHEIGSTFLTFRFEDDHGVGLAEHPQGSDDLNPMRTHRILQYLYGLCVLSRQRFEECNEEHLITSDIYEV